MNILVDHLIFFSNILLNKAIVPIFPLSSDDIDIVLKKFEFIQDEVVLFQSVVGHRQECCIGKERASISSVKFRQLIIRNQPVAVNSSQNHQSQVE